MHGQQNTNLLVNSCGFLSLPPGELPCFMHTWLKPKCGCEDIIGLCHSFFDVYFT